MPMLLHAPNQLYCTHCQTSYFGNPPVLEHPKYDTIAVWGSPDKVLIRGYLDRLKSCPHAGHFYKFPIAEEIA